MTLLHRLASMARWIFCRNTAEQQLDDEVQAFAEMSAADKIRDGLSPVEAIRQARLELGGLEQTKEKVRTGRHGAWLDEIGRDVRYAIRTSLRSPGFTLTVVLTLALGIGANTAIFSLIDALMLRWLPVANPQQLVQLTAGSGPVPPSFSYNIVRAFDEQHDIFDGVTGFSGFSVISGSSNVPAALVTGAFYDTLGLKPALGRLLARADDERGAPLVAVISDDYWERQFARSPDVIGQTARLNNVPVTIVGVSPPGFVGAEVGATADITLPVAAIDRVSPDAAALLGPGNFWLRVLARPRPGISVPEATARLQAVWTRIADSVISPQWPASRRKEMADLVFQLRPGGTGWTNLRDAYSKPLSILMTVVAVVLLIACFNIAGLLLARSSARQKEIVVRLALGARRGQIVRQLLVESTMLSLTGAALAIWIAWVGGRFIVSLTSNGPLAVVFDLTPNWRILGFTSAVAIATGMLFGLAPAFQATAASPTLVLKDDMRMSGAGSRLLQVLVSAQVALSLVLLVGAGLLVRTFENLQQFDPGFSRENVLLVDLPGRGTPAPRELVEEVQHLPGVISASVSTHTPMSGALWSEPAVPAGQPIPDNRDTALFVGAGPGFLQTMQIRLLAGRDITDRDIVGSSDVALVNEQFAKRYMEAGSPVGRHLAARVRGATKDLEIVGLVRNTNVTSMRSVARSIVYVSYAQLTSDNVPTTLTVRVSSASESIVSDVKRTLEARLPGTPVDVDSLTAHVDGTMTQERMMATLAVGFGLLALVVASVGLYGLLAYLVARRTKEIGIRRALGADRASVMWLVVGNAAKLVVTGVVIGLPAAWLASRSVESVLFGLRRTDPIAVGVALLTLTTAALVAALLPTRRAVRVDPLIALRHE